MHATPKHTPMHVILQSWSVKLETQEVPCLSEVGPVDTCRVRSVCGAADRLLVVCFCCRTLLGPLLVSR